MRLFHAVTAVQLLAARLVAAVPVDSADTPAVEIDPTAAPLDALAQLQQYAVETLEQSDSVAKRAPQGCSLRNTAVRRDW
jgi:tyrosinase